MKVFLQYLCLFVLIYTFETFQNYVLAQNDSIPVRSDNLQNSISTDPILPLFNSFAITYEYQRTIKSSFIIGFWYGKATETYPKLLEYPGYAVNISLIFAYRYYVWRKLHVEYQLYPGYTKYYEKNEDVFYKSFNLFNEFRIGYKFNFQFFSLPLLINLQLPIGFTIFDTNEPETFKAIRKQDPIFYIFIPNIYLGIRF
jgi:hypothetical protein